MARFKNAYGSRFGRASLLAIGLAAVGGALLSGIVGVGAFAASVSGASFTGGDGTTLVGGTVYAKQGGILTLTVTTDAKTNCVQVSNAHTAQQTSSATKTSWSFSFTAGAGDGIKTVTVTAWEGNKNHPCDGKSASGSASYMLDNTGPVVTGTKDPLANAAGWNRTDFTIKWAATDMGAGLQSGPTPASETVTSGTTDAGVTKSASATDKLGNVGNGSVVVKLDKTLPTIAGSRSPAANGSGWNNQDVTVSFTCADSPSGIKSCPAATTLSSNGTNQSVSGKSIDIADNESAAAVVDKINIDKVAPTLSGAPTTAPDGDNGWYRSNVAIKWTCNDTLSDIAGSCPANSVISGEGQSLTASASVSDNAGNQTSATSAAVKIDKTNPTTTASATSGAWNNQDVTVELDGDDALSGPARTYFKVGTDGQSQLYSSVNKPSFSQDGVYELAFWTVDEAGNAETQNVIQVKIDKTNPTITHTLSPAANLAGWNNADTTVSFICADPGGSGIKEVGGCTGDIVVKVEGFNPITGTALDNAGNSASESFDVRLDKTAPSIVAGADRAANGAGWYRDDVTVSFSCDDVKPAGVTEVSGLASCPAAKTLGEGADQSAGGTATDTAGNTASGSVSKINIDKTKPILTGKPKTDANGDGWYSGDVTVAWTCSDGLSGIAGSCPTDSTVGGEGDNLSASRSVSDVAGNTTNTTVAPIRIDRTAPSTSVDVPKAPDSGWYAGDVRVTLTGVDALSKVDKTYYSVGAGAAQVYSGPFDHALKGVHTITFWSVDKAGNVEDRTAPGHSITLKIDGTPPSIKGNRTPANGFGWNNDNVTVSFDCNDNESGIAGCTPPVTLSNEGEGQSVTGDAIDVAGNRAQDTVAGINIDRTAPSLIGAPTTNVNGAGWYRGDVNVKWTPDDGLSGIDPTTVPANSTITGEGSNRGAGPVSVSDKAGNTATASVTGIKIDRSAPVVNGAPTTSPNGDGWYRGNVAVAFSCVDPLLADGTAGSGVASCPSNEVLQGDGANQSVTSVPATDMAGNSSAGKTVGGINIDGSEPQTSAELQCTGKNGYCKGATATVVLSATDIGPSGVKEIRYKVNGGQEKVAAGASTSVIVPLNGSGLANVVYWAIDMAGNVELAGASELKYDNIAPIVTHTLDPNANAADWSKVDTWVRFKATDDFSGVDESTLSPDVHVTGETLGQVVTGKADDMAGNTGSTSVTVKLDKTAPQISGAPTTSPGPGGWYSGPVTVRFTCGDALSGIATCPKDVTITANGAGQSVEGTAIDNAGNEKSVTVSGINIDSTKPAVVVKGLESGAIYRLGAVPTGSCDATDAGSGVSGGCSVAVSGGLANGVGTFSYSATATDAAGNTETVTGSYRVIYGWDGFQQPINDTAHSVDSSTSVFKAQSTVPAKLRLRRADGSTVEANTLPTWLTPARGGLTSAAVDETVFSDPATSGSSYRWDATDRQYIYNWGTAKNQAGYYWRIGVKLDDGQTYTVNVGLR